MTYIANDLAQPATLGIQASRGAQPLNLLARSTTAPQASFCATNPAVTDCPGYATATAGVSFEEFDGGTLSAAENKWQIDEKSKTGLSFIGALILAVVASFAMVAVMAAAGIGAAGAAATTGLSASSTGVTMGSMGSFLVRAGTVTPFASTVAAVAFESAYVALSVAVLGGANLGSTINLDAGVLLENVTVSRGLVTDMPSVNEYEGKIAQRIKSEGLMTSNMANGPVWTNA